MEVGKKENTSEINKEFLVRANDIENKYIEKKQVQLKILLK